MTSPIPVLGLRPASDPMLGEKLHDHAAILLRDTGLATADEFRRWLREGSADLLDYDYGSTPRSRVTEGVYTSTEYPPHQHIPQHNEMAYTDRWPRRLWFFCARPAEHGGTTPLSDARAVLARLDPALRRRFEADGVLYVRNYNLGVDLTWQQAFDTQDRAEVERRGRELGIALEWGPDDLLTTRQVAQATTRHRITGEPVWFNQAHLFHISALEPAVQEALLGAFGQDGLPRNAYYGNGAPIEASALEEIRGVYRELQREFPWQSGDVLVIDNVLMTHGRTPFRGPRSILVAMSELDGRS
jgi:alpha-ketoglutarate-dependent taurine dioxygenase